MHMNTQKKMAFQGNTARRAATGAILALSLVTVMTFLASCSQAPIFAAIETEEVLKKATLEGSGLSMVVASTTGAKKAYVTNGYVWTKAAHDSEWTKIGTPDGLTCRELATDALDGKGALYGFFTSGSDWMKNHSVRKWDGSNWIELGNSASVEKIGSGKGWIYGFVDDGTVTGPLKEHRYNVSIARIGGTGFDTQILTNAGQYLERITSAGSYFATESYASGTSTSEVWFYDGFSTTAAKLTATDISTEGAAAITADVNDHAYVLTGIKVYELDSTGVIWTSDAHGLVSSIPYQPTGIAILDTAGTDDAILVSGSSGYRMYSGNVATNTWNKACITPTTPANYTSSLGSYRVTSIWAVPDEAPSNGYVLFAAVANTTKGGLWAYVSGYSWNRE
jgi:hypothetical protein